MNFIFVAAVLALCADLCFSEVNFKIIKVVNSSCSCPSPSSCAELLLKGNTKSGIYTIYPRPWYKPIPFKVYCDMETNGGGWTLFQRRDNYTDQEDFYRNWEDHKNGFGSLNKDFWLGNEHLYVLTNQDHVSLRVDLADFNGNTRWAEFSHFRIDDETDSYKLTISGYSGNAGDSMSTANQQLFTTYDRNDVFDCAKVYRGAWWYKHCMDADLNGLYLKGNFTTPANGVVWNTWLGFQYSLKVSQMKVRPTNFLSRSC